MNPFTGGCHYDEGCGKYVDKCGTCPQLGSSRFNDLSNDVLKRKHEAYQRAIERNQLYIVAPSEWLARSACSSSLFSGAPVRVIPYGLNHMTFRPRETAGMRSALGIPRHHRIVLFVAQSMENRRKGFSLLADALTSFSRKDTTLISIGTYCPDLDAGVQHLHLGSIGSDLLLSAFYSLADIFVIPSRQDNLPNTVLESMACGTPVVGFNAGGIPDMVRPGETGWLAETGDARALREAVEKALIDDATREQMGHQCRAVAEEEYTLEKQARCYKQLYESIIGDEKGEVKRITRGN